MPTTLQKVTLQLTASNPTWLDTGVIVKSGETLRVRTSGEVWKYSPEQDYFYPEGTYSHGDRHTGPPGTPLTYSGYESETGIAPSAWVVSDTAPLAVSLIFSDTQPLANASPQLSAYRVNRDVSINDVSAVGRVWMIVNDTPATFSYPNNGGVFNVTLERTTTDAQDIDPGQPSPLRGVPDSLLITDTSANYVRSWMLAVKPIRGDWEGYTDWDAALVAPSYADDLGNETPALTYQPTGATLTNMNTQLRLGTTALEAKLLAPRSGAMLPDQMQGYFSREKILKGDYEGGYWELFEVDPESDMVDRILWGCGQIGQAKVDDLSATPELTSYDELPNRVVGRTFGALCDVGTEYLDDGSVEEFGTGRCRNVVLADGPDKQDWTVLATVSSPVDYGVLRLSFGSLAVSGATLDAAFADHMANGAIKFLSSPDGGLNSDYKVGIKKGSSVSSGVVDVTLKASTLYLPVVGDKLYLTAGCRRVFADCDFFDNVNNFRGFNLVGSDDLLRRTREN